MTATAGNVSEQLSTCLLVEFRELEVLGPEEARELDCLAVFASPYAEQLSVRFDSYRGRVGVPDLDLAVVIGKLGPVPKSL